MEAMKILVDETLLKLVLNTSDVETLFRNCESNKEIDRVCRENQELIGKELLRKRGYSNGTYSRLKRFFKLDPKFRRNAKNIIMLYQQDDKDLLKMILDVGQIVQVKEHDTHELTNMILDVIHEKTELRSGLLLLIELVKWDLLKAKTLPDQDTLSSLLIEHNSVYGTKYNLKEYSKLFESQINNKIKFTDLSSLQIKIAVMFQDWTFCIENPCKFN